MGGTKKLIGDEAYKSQLVKKSWYLVTKLTKNSLNSLKTWYNYNHCDEEWQRNAINLIMFNANTDSCISLTPITDSHQR